MSDKLKLHIGELEALENFHRFRVTRVDESLFEYIYASRFKVSIPCNNYLPITSNLEISHVVDATVIKDDFPQFTNIILQAAKVLVHHSNPKSCKMVRLQIASISSILTAAQILQMLSGYWSCCSQLRAQLRLVSIKYPIEFLLMDVDGMPGFKVKAKVMIPPKKAKVFVIFNFTCDVFSKWPMSVNLLASDVTVGYGPVE
jgi:kinetochore protein Spc7/SPC105